MDKKEFSQKEWIRAIIHKNKNVFIYYKTERHNFIASRVSWSSLKKCFANQLPLETRI